MGFTPFLCHYPKSPETLHTGENSKNSGHDYVHSSASSQQINMLKSVLGVFPEIIGNKTYRFYLQEEATPASVKSVCYFSVIFDLHCCATSFVFIEKYN